MENFRDGEHGHAPFRAGTCLYFKVHGDCPAASIAPCAPRVSQCIWPSQSSALPLIASLAVAFPEAMAPIACRPRPRTQPTLLLPTAKPTRRPRLLPFFYQQTARRTTDRSLPSLLLDCCYRLADSPRINRPSRHGCASSARSDAPPSQESEVIDYYSLLRPARHYTPGCYCPEANKRQALRAQTLLDHPSDYA
jgi:hypothetical protein